MFVKGSDGLVEEGFNTLLILNMNVPVAPRVLAMDNLTMRF